MANAEMLMGETFDARLLLHTGAKTSSGVGSVAYIDLGPGTPAQFMAAIIDLTAFDIVSNDETYDIVIQGSPDTSFTAATSAELAAIHIGAKETKRTDTDKDDFLGRHFLAFANMGYSADNTPVSPYRYIRAYFVVAGTTPTITGKIHLTPLQPKS
jgi:hypothetical protein